MADFATAERKRDARLRRRLLQALNESRHAPLGGLHGQRLVEAVDGAASPGEGFDGSEHAIALLRDLVNKGFVTEADQRKRRTQPWGLDYLFFKITALGSSLLNETAGPDPDVDDERNLEG